MYLIALSWASIHVPHFKGSVYSSFHTNLYMQFISQVSIHAGRNRELCLRTHGCLPGTLRYYPYYPCILFIPHSIVHVCTDSQLLCMDVRNHIKIIQIEKKNYRYSIYSSIVLVDESYYCTSAH